MKTDEFFQLHVRTPVERIQTTSSGYTFVVDNVEKGNILVNMSTVDTKNIRRVDRRKLRGDND